MPMETTTIIESSTLGLDLGDTQTRGAVLNQSGELVEECSIQTSPQTFARFFQRFEGSTAAMEIGSQSRWASQLLIDMGLKVLVANPCQLSLIYGSKNKNDKLDAERLARLARFNSKLLHAIEHRPANQQADLENLKARDLLVRTRPRTVCHIRGVLKSYGVKMKSCDTESFANQVKSFVPEPLGAIFEPLLHILDAINAQIAVYDKTINTLCRDKYAKETSTLQQVNGVGPVTALTFVLTIGDPGRFKSSRCVGSFFGLCPSQCESGDSSPQLSITRAGDTRVRVLLVQCAQYILGPFGKDCDLRRWGLRKAEHGGKKGKRKAIVAVARKLAVLLHRLLVTGQPYEPLRNSERSQAPTTV